MPSLRRQINVRLTEENEGRLARLVASMSASVGFEVSQSDVVQAGLVELEKRYPPLADTETATAKKGKKK